ncbi:MAG: hypothetical protein M5R36_13635 [Deltaproteobacteria bacterium]|nr:hypothetical protein [Deltaproteobacteria bacterium]
MRLLLTGDDPAALRRVGDLCGRHACAWRVEETFDAAYRALQTTDEPYHLLVIATETTGQEAEDLGRRVRADERLNATVIGLLAVYGRPGDAARLREIGFSFYLTPPYSDEALESVLERSALLSAAGLRPPPPDIVTRHSLLDETRGRARALVIEPNPMAQWILEHLLAKYGIFAAVAADEEEAAEQLRRARWDIVFADPAAWPSGGEALRDSLRRSQPGARLIALGDATTPTEEFDAVLPRPFQTAALLDILDGPIPRAGERAPSTRAAAVVDRASLIAAFADDAELVRDLARLFVDETRVKRGRPSGRAGRRRPRCRRHARRRDCGNRGEFRHRDVDGRFRGGGGPRPGRRAGRRARGVFDCRQPPRPRARGTEQGLARISHRVSSRGGGGGRRDAALEGREREAYLNSTSQRARAETQVVAGGSVAVGESW